MSGTGKHPPSSPTCYASQADPAYQGYFTNDEIIAQLQPLLEAERAGTRISRETAKESTSQPPSLRTAIEDLQDDESRYCTMLVEQIKRLGGTPGTKTGDFYDKCMAVEDLQPRLEFLNKGQNWVVRKINELMPRVSDEELLAALKEMRDTHEANIARMHQLLAQDA